MAPVFRHGASLVHYKYEKKLNIYTWGSQGKIPRPVRIHGGQMAFIWLSNHGHQLNSLHDMSRKNLVPFILSPRGPVDPYSNTLLKVHSMSLKTSLMWTQGRPFCKRNENPGLDLFWPYWKKGPTFSTTLEVQCSSSELKKGSCELCGNLSQNRQKLTFGWILASFEVKKGSKIWHLGGKAYTHLIVFLICLCFMVPQ